MLIQMPRGPTDQPGPNSAEARNAFEAALRRDLASSPVVSYDAVLGGWGKRAADIVLVLLTAPLWAPTLGIAACISKLRHSAPVLVADERVGYGGQAFQRYALRIEPPTQKVEEIIAGTDENEQARAWRVIETQAEDRRAKWVHALERLPQMLNVLRGEMAIVGPSPLTRDELEPMKSAKRHYLSARPGIVGVSAILDGHDDRQAQYKAYAMSWSFLTDTLIFWDGLRSLLNRGELWSPGLVRAKADAQRAVIVRKRPNV
jgi:lipopolysaccharide/colanic/teichoic acid biosynthesis glycosyltransferase